MTALLRNDVDAAVRAADAARPQLSSLLDRSAVLATLADAADADADRILVIAGAETHLAGQRLRGELLRTTHQLRAFARAAAEGALVEATIDLSNPVAQPVPTPDVRSVLRPVGVTAVFAASNFPLAFSVLGGDSASALAAGCPVVVKAHPGHPELSDLMATISRAAVGPGVVEVVHGQREGLDLLGHPLVRAASFTGSLAGARALQDRIDQRPDPIPFYGELGSINPVVVMPAAAAAARERLMRELAASFTQSSGQLCTKPGLVLVPTGLADRLADLLVENLNGTIGARMLTRGIHERFAEGVERLAAADGVVLAAGRNPAGDPGPLLFTAFARDLPDVALEELFGPATVLVGYDDLTEVLAVLGRIEGSLTGTVHAHAGDDQQDVVRVLDALAAFSGRVIHNGWPTGVAVVGAMNHGGPWPAATTALHTSVGLSAARRFLRPIAFQDLPDALLPVELQDSNPLGILRTVDGMLTADPVHRSSGGGHA